MKHPPPVRWTWSLRPLCIVLLLLYHTEAQFRSQGNRQHFEEPYNRPTTSRPQRDRFFGRDEYQNSGNVRYRGYDLYRLNQRGGIGLTQSERDRLRVNYAEQDPDFQEFELRNTIFDRWRPDLQGEKRPGEIPGVNLPLAEDVFVTTDTGKIQGFYVYLYDMPTRRPEDRPAQKPLELQRHLLNVTVFLGIPYAQPPVVEGRFKPPRRVRNWHTTWQAIDYSPACPQNLKYVGVTKGIRSGIDEDCLYLNVFTPSLSVNARERYPVMFYIHGGDFDHGAGSQFPGHMLSAWGNVVVVTFNYRLGALGFLSTGDYHSPGNYGLMDMAMALEWVYNNIRFFNGDGRRITVFGPGSGGAAAGLLAVLPRSRDYVNQVIGESGSPLAEWAAIDDPYRVQNTSRVFGLAMGCNVENSYEILRCLVNRDYEELATAPIIPDIGTFPWSPVIDGNFTVPNDDWYEDWDKEDFHILPERPLVLYQNNFHHPNLRYLTGVNRDEAANMAFEDERLKRTGFEVSEEFFNQRIRDWVLHYNYTLNPDGTFDAIKWMYTFWPDPKNTTHIREEYINMLSDALYKSPVDQLVKVLTNSTNKRPVPTYYYLLNTTVEALRLPYWRQVPNNIEYYFITGGPFMDPELYPESIRISRHQWTEGDRNMSQFMMKTFANFAQWGEPTHSQVEPIRVKWEPTVHGSFRYLSINTTFNTSIHYNYRQPQTTFWYEYIPLVVRELIPTPPPPRNPWIDMTEPVTATMYGLLAFVIVLVIFLVFCFGLWKSAKKQKNKALEDLSCYSTENLSLFKENGDFEVRKYLEKLGQPKNSPSQTGTIHTMLSAESTGQSTRPITPASTVPNGKLTEPDSTYSTLRKPVHQETYSSEPKSRVQAIRNNFPEDRRLPLDASSLNSYGDRKSREDFEPYHVSKPPTQSGDYPQPYQNPRPYQTMRSHQPQFIESQQYQSIPSQQYQSIDPHQYQSDPIHQYNQPVQQQSYHPQQYQTLQPPPNRNVQYSGQQSPAISHKYDPEPYQRMSTPISPPAVHQEQPQMENPAMRDSDKGPVIKPTSYDKEPERRLFKEPVSKPSSDYFPKPAERHHFQAPVKQEEIQNLPNVQYTAQHVPYSSANGDNYHDENDPTRSVTPAPSSAVTFEISMKPAKSLGTISNASGLILNTDL